MIKVYEKALTKKFCNELIKKFNKDKKKLDFALPGGNMAKAINLTTSKYYKKEDDVIRKAIDKCYDKKYREDVQAIKFYGEYSSTNYIMQKLKKDKGDSKLHIDNFGPSTAGRYLAIVFFINSTEDYNIHFPFQGERVEDITQGDALLFPPFWTHPHTVATPTSGDQYIVTAYITFQR